MLLRTQTSTGDVLRNVEYVPGRALTLPYPSIELLPADKVLGVTLVSATLRVAPTFGQSLPTVTKTITAVASAAGQITDNAASDGIGALSFVFTPSETSIIASPSVFELLIVDSLGRVTPLDAGAFVADPDAIIVPASTVTVTPTPVNVPGGSTQQMTAVVKDANGNVLPDVGVLWASSNPAFARVNGNGLVTGVAVGGPVTITATAVLGNVSGAAQVTTTQALDGSYADVIARCAEDSVPIRKFRDARLAVSDGVGVQTVPCVPGVVGPALKVYENGGGNIHRPALDPVKKTIRTGGTGGLITFASENFDAGDVGTDFSVGVWKLVLGAFVSVGSGTPIMGLQHPNRIGEALLQGGFDAAPQTVDSFLYTDGNPSSAPHSYFWQTKAPLGSTNCSMFGWFLPPGNGVDNSLNSTPWAKSLRLGVEGPRTLPHGQPSANQFTAFGAGPCRDFYGPEPRGTQAAPIIDSSVDYIYASELETSAPPTWRVIAAWKRYCALHPAYVAPVRATAKWGAGFGHSLMRGNGASDLAHAIPGATQTHLGAGYQIDNVGLSGDGYANAQIEPYLTYRLGGFWSDERDHDWLILGPLYVNDANNSVPVATCLTGADAICARARQLWPPGKLNILGVTETTEAPNPPGIPNQAAYNAGFIAREGTTFDKVARPDLDPNIGTNSNPTNATYWLDGEHRKDAGYDIDGTVNAAAIVAAGG